MRKSEAILNFARKSLREPWQALQSTRRNFLGHLEDRGRKIPHLGNDRTAYLIGLFGSGRWYINELMLRNVGARAKYLRDSIRLHSGPTSMIYSGHATIKYPSCFQAPPSETSCILEAGRSKFADLIFIYRHPIDSLLTNWVWWRTYLRDRSSIAGISEVYRNTDDLCSDLDRNFSDFKAIAEGNPDYFVSVPGPRFLSFAEFVEETELYLQSATLTLRLEDFAVDPLKEFLKIVETMSVNVDLKRPRVVPPRTKPYRYLTVKENVSQFRNFIDGMSVETRRRLERMGYAD
jgi:hypothetical protein